MLEACSQYWWLPLLLAALIGLITAWWIWGGKDNGDHRAQLDVKPGDAAMTSPMAAAPSARSDGMDANSAGASMAVPDMAAAAGAAPLAAAAAVPLMAAAAAPMAKPAPAKKAAAKKPVAKKPTAKKPAAKSAAVAAKKMTVKKPAAAAAPKAAPAKMAKAKSVAAKPAAKPKPKIIVPDNLELLKGVGPKLNALLKAQGITSFEQVANWTAADVSEIDSKLGSFAGRIGRDNWVDQAKLLAKGDIAAFEKKYGSLGSEIDRG